MLTQQEKDAVRRVIKLAYSGAPLTVADRQWLAENFDRVCELPVTGLLPRSPRCFRKHGKNDPMDQLCSCIGDCSNKFHYPKGTPCNRAAVITVVATEDGPECQVLAGESRSFCLACSYGQEVH
jgi:hypothetical protein